MKYIRRMWVKFRALTPCDLGVNAKGSLAISLLIVLVTMIVLVDTSRASSCRQQDQSEGSGLARKGKTDGMVKHQSVRTVFDFLKWYKTNYHELNQINLINNFGVDSDSTKFYSVDFKGTEDYLLRFKTSGFISDKYINKWRRYFQERERDFKKKPQNEGPPEGFEYDFVLWTQEIDETLEKIDHPKLIEVKESSTSSTVNIDLTMKLRFTLSLEDGKWLIDNIENLGIKS